MSVRELRTKAPDDPQTPGERIRYARVMCGMSQPQLAEAIRRMTGTKTSSSLISKWENNHISSLSNPTLYAIQALTGYRMDWIIRGMEPRRTVLSKDGKTNTARLAKALGAALSVAPDVHDVGSLARVTAGLYDLLTDTPDVDSALLTRIASTFTQP